MLKFIEQLTKNELSGKKVLLRVDFDVPAMDGKIAEVFRIKAAKETVDYLIGAGAKVLMVGHLGHEVSDASFNPIVDELKTILGQTLMLTPHSELASVDLLFERCQLLLLDNIRQDPREIQNDDGLAVELAKGFDFYVDDAFATLHRNHASVAAVTKYLPSYAGLLVKKEIENLSRAIKAPAEGKIIVLGGAKISTKLPVIKNFVDRAEKILVGGALANNYFLAKGINVGASVVDTDVTPDVFDGNLVLPHDILVADDRTGESDPKPHPVADIGSGQSIVDIGPGTIKHFCEIIENSSMVVWNGPMGLYEVDKFGEGTRAIARAVASVPFSVIGGGDTIAAANAFGLLEEIGFVSTGGGAMLEFLAGDKLPGLAALGYYDF